MVVSSVLKFPTQNDFKYKVGEKVFIDYKYRQDNGENSEFVVLFQCTWYSDELFYHIMNDDKDINKIREIELISIEELRNRKIYNIIKD